MRVELLAGEKQPGETQKAIQACNDYLRMGPGRSLQKLLDRYRGDTETLPPTRRFPTLKDWSRFYGWQERVAIYDAQIEDEKNQRRSEILSTGLALDFERVVELKRLADFLAEELYTVSERGDKPNLWLEGARGGVTFNAGLIDQIRGILDDLAKETGGRKVQQVVSGEVKTTVKIIKGVSMDDL